MTYFNTNNETGETLAASRQQVATQQEVILDIFKENPGALFTPFDIKARVRQNWPITSIRRAMTNMSDDGELVKTDIQKEGGYGKANYCWKLKVNADGNGQLGMF